MARIKDGSVDEVKAAADIVAVISARTPLRKAGARFVGRCPFHEERTPSFSVNPTDKLYYCFGCGAKGDLITFVRETEQLDFAGAIEWLTDRQLKELGRLTIRVWLCFDGDAAGEAATLRGMELAAAHGLDVRVVALPAGFDPADLADGFEQRLACAESYLGYRVRLEIERAADRQEAFVRVREVLARFEDSPERQDAIRYAADKLDLPKETQAGLAPSASASATGRISPRLLDAGQRLERNALAGVAAHRSLVPILAELAAEHFDSEEHRRLREQLVCGGELDPELDARAAAEGIDERTAEELLLRLRERRIRRDLIDADPARTLELQAALAKIRGAVEQLATAQIVGT